MTISQRDVRHTFDYNSDTGVFIWKNPPKSNPYLRGKEAGTLIKSHKPYRMIRAFGKSIYAHRLAWLYVYGKFPDCQLDHINMVHSDNRISNLRECNQSQNLANRPKTRKNPTSKYKGVSFCKKTKKWRANYSYENRTLCLGRYSTQEEAAKVYDKKAIELYGEFAVLNFDAKQP